LSTSSLTFVVRAVGAERVQGAMHTIRSAQDKVVEGSRRIAESGSRVNAVFNALASRGAMLTTSMIGLSGSLMGLYNAYDAIAATEARVMKIEASYLSMIRARDMAQLRLNKLIEQGKQGTEEYAIAEKALEEYTMKVQAAQIRYEDSLDEVAKAKIRLYMAIVPTAMMTISTFTNALRGTTLATRALNLAHRTLSVTFLTSPIGLVMMGLAATAIGLYTAWKNNWFGIRDIVKQVGEWFLGVYDTYFKPWLQPLIDTLQGIGRAIGLGVPEAKASMEDLSMPIQDVRETIASLDSEIASLKQTMEDSWESMVVKVEESEASISVSLDAISEDFEKFNDVVVDVRESVESELDRMVSRFNRVRDSIRGAVGERIIRLTPALLDAYKREIQGLADLALAKEREVQKGTLTYEAYLGWLTLRIAKVEEAWSKYGITVSQIQRDLFALMTGGEKEEAFAKFKKNVEDAMRDANGKIREGGETLKEYLQRWRQIGEEPLPEPRLERIRRLYGEAREEAYRAEAILAATAGRWGEALRWAYAARYYPPQLLAWAREHPREWVELWKGFRGVEVNVNVEKITEEVDVEELATRIGEEVAYQTSG